MTNFIKPDLLSSVFILFDSFLDDTLLESVAALAIAQRTRPYSAIQFVAQLPVAELLHFWCVVFTVTGGEGLSSPLDSQGISQQQESSSSTGEVLKCQSPAGS
jgi:K+ transporter